MKPYRILILCLLLPVMAWGGNNKKDIALANKVADYQIKTFQEFNASKKNRSDLHWGNGALYRGMLMWNQVSGYAPAEDFVMNIGQKNDWKCGPRVYHADDICVGQAYLMLYQKYHRPEMLAGVKQRADSTIIDPSRAPVDIQVKVPDGKIRWTWCDALFMAPPVYSRLSVITGDEKYRDFMDNEYYQTARYLYDNRYNLFYRDSRYITRREKNGKPVFWGRGNGWVYAALTFILEDLPENHPTYPYYLKLYHEMTDAVIECQDAQGSWHASMLDRETFPNAENSGSGFLTYGLAWGINHGLLTGKEYRQAARNGWKAIKTYVDKDGRLGYVQPVGGSPQKAKPDQTEAYGVGAFLMAASEMIRMK